MRTDDPSTIVARRATYVLTPKGREVLRSNECCRCAPRWVGLLLECPLCGTIFGHYVTTPMSMRDR